MSWASKDDAAEWAIDVAAAAILAAAVAFAAWALSGNAGSVAAAAGALAFLLAHTILQRLPADEPRFVLPSFEPAPIEVVQESRTAGAELLLEDQLTGPEPDARVVQLFGSRPGPESSERTSSKPADASQQLSEALAALRRSLR